MRILVITGLLALGVACTSGGGSSNNNDSGEEASACPDGLSEARTSGALVTRYVQNGIGMALVFDPEITLASGQPAACVSSDRLLGQWVLSSAGEPAVVFRQSLTAFGSQQIDGSAGSATLEIVGIDQVMANEWSTGTWFADIDNSTGAVTSTIDANAATGGGGTYTLTASFEATP